jgi:3-phytase
MRRTVGIVALVAVTTVVAAPAYAADRPPAEITAAVEAQAPVADQPAILINGAGGLRVHDRAGREVQSIATPAGSHFTDVDLVRGFRIGGRRTDLAVVTDRGRDQLRIYRIEASGHLTDITAADAPLLFSRDAGEVAGQATAYGLATYGRYAVVSRRHTARLGIFRLEERAGRVTYRVTDTLDLPAQFRRPDGSTWSPATEAQVEGMVVDAQAGILYAAQRDVALWRIRLGGDQFAGAPRVVEYADWRALSLSAPGA